MIFRKLCIGIKPWYSDPLLISWKPLLKWFEHHKRIPIRCHKIRRSQMGSHKIRKATGCHEIITRFSLGLGFLSPDNKNAVSIRFYKPSKLNKRAALTQTSGHWVIIEENGHPWLYTDSHIDFTVYPVICKYVGKLQYGRHLLRSEKHCNYHLIHHPIWPSRGGDVL